MQAHPRPSNRIVRVFARGCQGSREGGGFVGLVREAQCASVQAQLQGMLRRQGRSVDAQLVCVCGCGSSLCVAGADCRALHERHAQPLDWGYAAVRRRPGRAPAVMCCATFCVTDHVSVSRVSTLSCLWASVFLSSFLCVRVSSTVLKAMAAR